MLTSYILAAFRNLRKYKFNSFITILGLSIGLAASVLAVMFAMDEVSFDSFHTKADRLYRLNKITTEPNGSTFLNAESSGLMGPTMVDEFPEVEKVVRYQTWFNNAVLSYKEHNHELNEAEILFVDSTFFDVFDFTLVKGNPREALKRPLTMVLTEEVATSLFGSEDPVGKTVTGINGLEFEVTGVAKAAPRNSHIQYKALVSWTTTTPQLGPLNFDWMNNWLAQALTTYVLVKPGTNVSALQAKLPKFLKDHLPNRVDVYQLYLQPFKEVYLHGSEIKYHRMAKTGSIQYIYVFAIIAGFILLIACINYVNISTSRSTRRAREVGMRKSLGATKGQLVLQFLGESFLITALSVTVAVALIWMAIPWFNDLAGKSLVFELLYRTEVLLGLLAVVVVVALLSGFYPAVVLAAFRPSEVLKASAKSKLTGHWPRQVLITFQLVISITMIAGTLLVYQQMKYVLSKDLGFDQQHVLVINLSNDVMAKGETFEQLVKSHPSVVSTSLGRTALGAGNSSTYIIPEGFPPDEVEVRMFPADGNFQKTYDLQMAKGRFFDVPRIANDSNAVVINEALARRLKWDDPMKKTLKFNPNDTPYNIVGVLKDFHFKSLYDEVEPLVMWIGRSNRRNLSVRFSGNPKALISFIESKWKTFESRYPFRHFFVDEAFAKAYQSDDKLFKTVMTFSAISIIIACLGLYGLVSFTIEQRIKEIGIRKVLGASVSNLNFLVNKKFVLMVVLAGAVAVPMVIPVINKWLTKFAYKINIGPEVFLLATGLVLLVTLVAVSIQVIRAAVMNPVEALRNE
ncbi:ABC transporter permease [Cytophagales bacterium WSM2-2]|nr:ABC transporter permease [Cytophagales bacterium WSM2-2]